MVLTLLSFMITDVKLQGADTPHSRAFIYDTPDKTTGIIGLAGM